MKVIGILGIILCGVIALMVIVVTIRIVVWLCKNEVKPEDVAYLDNSEFDFGHNIKHSSED